jgi:hypothetical protein
MIHPQLERHIGFHNSGNTFRVFPFPSWVKLDSINMPKYHFIQLLLSTVAHGIQKAPETGKVEYELQMEVFKIQVHSNEASHS